MANHASSKKRIRRNANRSVINKARLSRIRTFIKKVETAIQGGDKKQAQAALQQAQPEIDRGAAKGIMHKSAASRKMARLSRRIKAM